MCTIGSENAKPRDRTTIANAIRAIARSAKKKLAGQSAIAKAHDPPWELMILRKNS